MALIGKIRDKSWLVLLVIGGALAAFILSDWQSLFSGSGFEYGYGTVNGEQVNMKAFDAEVADQQRMLDIQAQAQNQPTQQVNRDQVWTGFIEDLLLEKEYQALGIDVSEEEFEAYLFATEGFSPLAEFTQNFKDSVGNFSPQQLQARIDQMENSEDVNQQEIWKNYRESLKTRRKQEKYKDILAHSMYVSDLQAKDEYYAQQDVKSISFVLQRYSSIEDEEIDDSDANLKAYFEAHKEEKIYENIESVREIKLIDFALEPSGADSAKFEKSLASIKAGFAKTTNDSIFVLKNSESRIFTSMQVYYPVGDPNAQGQLTYPAYLDTVIKGSKVGDIIGPYEDQGASKVAKIIGAKDKLLSVRHILISATREDEAAVAKAQRQTDSIMAIISADNFEELVTKHSQDQGSVQNGGKYENFVDGRMVPEFSKFSMEEPIGKIGYVQTDYGFHIIEVLERKDAFVPHLAIVEKRLTPSMDAINTKQDEVHNLLYELDEKMAKLEDNYKKVEIFDTLAAQKGHAPQVRRILENKPQINGLASIAAENKLYELAFSDNSQVGDIVGSPVRDKERLLLAVVSAIKVKGPGTFEDMKEKVRVEYIKEKKAEKLTAKMAKAKTLTDLEDRENGVIVHKSEVTFGAPQIQNAGSDPYIVGAIFSGLPDGDMTKPIKGNLGVYVIKIEKTDKASPPADFNKERDQLTGSLVGTIRGRAMQGLTKLADVVDNRKLFNAGIRR